MKITMHRGSMDHTPSEQLVDLQQWHTTVLILSGGGEHWDLAADMARQMGCKNDTLKKWSGKRAAGYKQQFERAFTERVAAYPVHVRAISAQRKTITNCFDHMVQELGLKQLVGLLNDTGDLKFGPFLRISIEGAADGELKRHAEPETFTISKRQGIPLIFLVHFILRMHQQVLKLIQLDEPELEWID